MLTRIKRTLGVLSCMCALAILSITQAHAQTNNATTYTGAAPDMSSIITSLVTASQSYMVYIASAAFVVLALGIGVAIGMKWIKKAAKSS